MLDAALVLQIEGLLEILMGLKGSIRDFKSGSRLAHSLLLGVAIIVGRLKAFGQMVIFLLFIKFVGRWLLSFELASVFAYMVL